MAGVNFGKLGLIGASIQNVSLADADLSSLTDYSNSIWTNTAWWRAKRIEKSLLKYLIASFPFSDKAAYYEAENQKNTTPKSLDSKQEIRLAPKAIPEQLASLATESAVMPNE